MPSVRYLNKMMQDRRGHPRGAVTLAATVLDANGGWLGEYLVRNLSAGGALLIYGSLLAAGMHVRAILDGPGVESLRLDAVVQRIEIAPDGTPMAALEFVRLSRAVEEQLQRMVLRALGARARPAVLIVHESPVFLGAMARDVAHVGYQPAFAMTDLEIIRRLHDDDVNLRAVIAELDPESSASVALFEFMKDAYPGIRRIAIVRSGESGPATAQGLSHADETIELRWTRKMLGEALAVRDERVTIANNVESARPSAPP